MLKITKLIYESGFMSCADIFPIETEISMTYRRALIFFTNGKKTD